MKKFFASGIMFFMMSIVSLAQPADKTIIFVGGTGDPIAEDQVLIDSFAAWIENVIYYNSAAFNTTTAETLYADIDGVVISESINSVDVPNFGRRDDYPVPCIAMESVFSVPDDTDKWPLLDEAGGIWGYSTPEEVDIQWQIANEEHYITTGYELDDVIYYADTAGRGVPYVHGIVPDHIILATAVRTDGGNQEGYIQDEAIACAWIEDPEIIYMNIAHTYYAEGTEEWYAILKRSAQFIFDFMPVGVDRLLSPSTKLTVYPNPSAENASIRFHMEAGEKVLVNLISVTGGLVKNIYWGISIQGENIIDLDTDQLSSGLYFIELSVDDKFAYTKFVLK
jgi:hypothetical protein